MAQKVCVILHSLDRQRLEAIVADRNRSQRHVERARVVLAAAACGAVQPVATGLGVGRPMVWRMATALRRRGRGRVAAGQDAQAWQAADLGRDGGARCGADLH